MAMRFEKEKVSAEGSKMAIGSPGIDSAGNATLERIEDLRCRHRIEVSLAHGRFASFDRRALQSRDPLSRPLAPALPFT